MIDGSVKSGIHIIGIVGEGKKDFFLNMHERGVDIIEALRKSIKGDGRGMIVVSDGSNAIYQAVKEVLPYAIHVRAFHGEWRGVVAIHIRGDEGNYTVYTSWDIFSERKSKEKKIEEILVFGGEVVSPSKAIRMAGDTEIARMLVKDLEVNAKYLLEKLEMIAEEDNELLLGGSNRCIFEREYNRIGKYLRMVPRSMRGSVIEVLKEIVKKVIGGVRPKKKKRAERWLKIIARYGGFGDKELAEIVKKIRVRKKEEKRKVRFSDRPRAKPVFLGKYKGMEELKEELPVVYEALKSVEEVFSGRFITNNWVENEWSHFVRINVVGMALVRKYGSFVNVMNAVVDKIVEVIFKEEGE